VIAQVDAIPAVLGEPILPAIKRVPQVVERPLVGFPDLAAVIQQDVIEVKQRRQRPIAADVVDGGFHIHPAHHLAEGEHVAVGEHAVVHLIEELLHPWAVEGLPDLGIVSRRVVFRHRIRL